MGGRGKSGHVSDDLDLIMMSPAGLGKGLGTWGEEIG
jgi:hypothetical protein